MPNEPDRVERVIVDALSSFLDGSAAEPIPMLADALGRLFQRLLADEKGWSRFAWIDDAQPESMTRVDGSTVSLAGLATIVDGKRWSSQPFQAVLRLDPSRSRLDAFRLFLGDARSEMHAVPYGAKRPNNWPNVPDWIFTFDRAGAGDPELPAKDEDRGSRGHGC